MNEGTHLENYEWFLSQKEVKDLLDNYREESKLYNLQLASVVINLEKLNEQYRVRNGKKLFSGIVPRIKDEESLSYKLWRKVKENVIKLGYEQRCIEESYQKIYDKGGIRLIVEISEDIDDVVKRVKEFLNNKGFATQFDDNDLRDRSHKEPTELGYRAYHFHIMRKFSTDDPEKTSKSLFFEIQVRSYAHDTWANFSHNNVYDPFKKKGIELPKDILAYLRNISDQLQNIDNYMAILRKQINGYLKKTGGN